MPPRMVAKAMYLSVLLYLVPLFVLLAVRSRRDRETWEIGLDIPLAVALDLIGVLVLSRGMRLESAVLVSRPLWVLSGAAYVVWRKRTGRTLPGWPRAVGWREIAMVGVAVALAVLLSMEISRPCLNTDRRWHIPLVASLRGQTMPFHNVYDTRGILAYHYAGNVFAAEIQTLSWNVLHASLALSLSHDVLFGLTAASIGLLVHGGGLRGTAFIAAAALGFLLSGPITLLRPDGSAAGYSYVDFFRISFRPHTSLGALLLVGFLGAAWVRLRGDARAAPIPIGRTWPVLVACTAVLALSDEASVGLLGLSLGAAWLVTPETIHPKRLVGLGVLAALFAALVGATLAFSGSLSPGAPKQVLEITPWRVIGFHHAPIPLTVPAGREFLYHDTLSIFAVWLAGAITVLRERQRRGLGLFVLYTTLVLASFVLLARVEVGGDQEEGHRFVTGAMLATPLFGLWWLLRAREAKKPRARGALVPTLVVTSIGLSAASTLFWLRTLAPKMCDSAVGIFTTENLHETNCRTRMGTRLGETTTPEYVAKPLAYWYEGCHSVFAPTSKQPGQHWAIATGMPIFGYEALATLQETMLRADEPLRATCPPGGLADDPVCTFALAKGGCQKLNAQAVRCVLTPADRLAILAKQPHAPAK